MSPIAKRAAVAALFAAFALAGCKNVSFRSASDDAKAKAFVVTPGKSAIYVVRPEAVRNQALSVVLDDKLTARTGPCSYLLWEVDPGAHEILAYGENISQLALRTEPGKAYFVRQDVAGGLWMPRTLLTAVDEPGGRKSIGECRLVDSGAATK
ncbi:MAG: DUF2846 domain-containing protein [Sterolibacteriaceae bacterium]|nr:DUF2846 domain-containing protein [Candidatus Methylophosphatis haderslevensis]